MLNFGGNCPFARAKQCAPQLVERLRARGLVRGGALSSSDAGQPSARAPAKQRCVSPDARAAGWQSQVVGCTFATAAMALVRALAAARVVLRPQIRCFGACPAARAREMAGPPSEPSRRRRPRPAHVQAVHDSKQQAKDQLILTELEMRAVSLAAEGRASEIEALIVEARKRGVGPSHTVVTALFSAYMQQRNAARALDVILRMPSQGFKVDILFSRSLVGLYVMQKDTEGALVAMETMREAGIVPRRTTIAKMMAYVPRSDTNPLKPSSKKLRRSLADAAEPLPESERSRPRHESPEEADVDAPTAARVARGSSGAGRRRPR